MSGRITRSRQNGDKNIKQMPSAVLTVNKSPKRRQQKQIESSPSDNDEQTEPKEEGTPPKNGRFSRNPDSNYSPSSLINRIRLTDAATDEDVENEIKPIAVPARKKIENARKVLHIAETENLSGREKELDELTTLFEKNLNAGTSASMYVSGQPGTGKTACITKILKSPLANKFKKIYINCTSLQTPATIFKAIAIELGLKTIGDKEANLNFIENYICTKRNKMVLLVLDEIDELIEKKQSVLYTIFEWPALPKSKILLIGIANSLDLTNRALSRLQINSDLKPLLMHFAPYTKQQIIDIFKSRLEAAGILDVFPLATIQLLSAKVAAMSGDVRKALDMGRRIAELATNRKTNDVDLMKELGVGELDDEQKYTEPKVEMTQVINVLNSVYSTARTLDDDSTDSFPLQQKFLICTLLLMLNNGKNKDITIGRLHAIYVKVCAKRGIPAIDESEFVSMCTLTETKGIIRIIKNKVSRMSKVQLQWDQEEITAAIRDKQLIAQILGDKSCLNK